MLPDDFHLLSSAPYIPVRVRRNILSAIASLQQTSALDKEQLRVFEAQNAQYSQEKSTLTARVAILESRVRDLKAREQNTSSVMDTMRVSICGAAWCA